MKILFLYVFLIVFPCFCFCQQKQAAVWRYGRRNQFDFNYSPRKITITPFGGPFSSSFGCASICDSLGKLLFYTNGAWIRSANDSAILFIEKALPIQYQFGSGQWGGDIIIPFQNKNGVHRYFIVWGNAQRRRNLFQFQVDMNKRNGLGQVDSAETKLFSDRSGDQVACMLHANGKDTWLISRQYQSDSLIAWHIVDTGVVQKVFTKLNSPAKSPNILMTSGFGTDSQLKSSPNSEFLLIPRRTIEYPFHELFKFNRETGVFYNKVLIKDTVSNGALYINGYPDGAFSTDSKMLYLTTGTRGVPNDELEGVGNFWQYNLENYDSASIESSKIFLGRFGAGNQFNANRRPLIPRLQIAMDGRIYVSSSAFPAYTDMSIIHCPDKRGSACLFKLFEINLGLGRNGSFFPTLNQTFVRNAGIFQLQANKRTLCRGDTLELSAYGAGAEKFSWSVSPALPQTAKVDTLTWQKIDTKNIPPGTYTFSCNGKSRCGDQYDKSITVIINAKPELPGPTLTLPGGEGKPCIGDSVFVKVAIPQSGHKYFWSTGDSTSSIVVKQTGKYSLDSVSNAFGCGIKVSDTVSVVIKDAAKPAVPVLLSANVNEVCPLQTIKLKVQSSGFRVVWSDGQEGDSVSAGIGKYSAFSQTVEGCASSASDTIQVKLKTIPAPLLVSPKVNQVCIGEKTKLKVQSSGHKVVWSDGQVGDSVLVGSGQYSAINTTAEGCLSKSSDTIQVVELSNPQPIFINVDSAISRESLQNQNYCVQGLPGSKFSFFVQGGAVVDSSQDCITINWNPLSIVNYPLSIKVTETLENPQCSGSVIQNFTYRPGLQIPTLITPNGDGNNDAFVIEDLEFYGSHSLQILNRWGKKVLESSEYKNDWQGVEGLYFYSLVVDVKQISGWVLVEK